MSKIYRHKKNDALQILLFMEWPNEHEQNSVESFDFSLAIAKQNVFPTARHLCW